MATVPPHPQLDRDGAWRLLLALRAQPPLADGRRTVRATGDGGPELTLHADGRWAYRGAGIDDGAARLLDLYGPLCRAPGTAFVIGQMGQSLDGRIATARGHSHYVTGEADRERLHRLRALVDAVVVGAGTIAADNPRLTVRYVAGDSPTRVILDRRGRLAGDSHVFCDGAAATLRVADRPAPGRVPSLAVAESGPAAVLAALAERGLTRVLVEGGGRTVSRFLEAGCLQRLHVTIAPVIIGDGPTGLTLPPIARMDEALRPACRRFELGDDVLFDLELVG